MSIFQKARDFAGRVKPALNVLRGAPVAGITHPADLLKEIDRSQISTTGAQVNAETAMRVSAVNSCVSLIAENLASLPMILYRRTGNDGRERATDHPLYNLLRRRPTRRHTKMDWYGMQTLHGLLRGNSYARRSMLRGGKVLDELLPMHPSRVYPETKGGAWVYRTYPESGGSPKDYSPEEIFHFRGISTDGFLGRSVIADARESIGLAIAQEAYGAGSYKHGGNKRGVLVHPGNLTEDAGKRLRKQMEEIYGGTENLGKWMICEENMKPEVFSMTAEDLQYLESRHFQIADIARLFRVPLPLIQETEKSTSWGSGIEQLMLGFVQFTLRTWGTRWEEAIQQQLLGDDNDEYFCEFMYDSLLRGDIEKRYRAYGIARQWGWMNVDQIRARENMNPLPDGKGQEYLRPSNMTLAGMQFERQEKPQEEGK